MAWLRAILVLFGILTIHGPASAQDMDALVDALAPGSFKEREAAVIALAATGDPAVVTPLEALSAGNLYARKSDLKVFIAKPSGAVMLLTAPAHRSGRGRGAEDGPRQDQGQQWPAQDHLQCVERPHAVQPRRGDAQGRRHRRAEIRRSCIARRPRKGVGERIRSRRRRHHEGRHRRRDAAQRPFRRRKARRHRNALETRRPRHRFAARGLRRDRRWPPEDAPRSPPPRRSRRRLPPGRWRRTSGTGSRSARCCSSPRSASPSPSASWA